MPKSDLQDSLRLLESKIPVHTVIDGQTLVVGRAGQDRILHLPAIYIPWETPYSVGAYGARAKAFLEENLSDNTLIRLYQVRHNERALHNALGHEAMYIEREDGWFAQEALVQNGLAFAYPTQSHFAVADRLYTAEESAREAKLGFWAQEEWQVLTPETVQKVENRFAIVMGKVHAVASRNNVIYLNFGENWRSDFTVAMDSRLRRDFAKAGISTMDLGDKIIEARGWVRDYNGAFMEVFHPSQVRIISSSSAPPL